MTSFEEVYKLFLNTISSDYRITNLFLENPEIAEDLLYTWLIKSVATFQLNSEIKLEEFFNPQEKTFGQLLTITEMTILSNLMILEWQKWNINNITQMNTVLNDLDYKRHSESANLRAKQEYFDDFRETVYHDISQYNLKKIPFAEWAAGNYGI